MSINDITIKNHINNYIKSLHIETKNINNINDVINICEYCIPYYSGDIYLMIFFTILGQYKACLYSIGTNNIPNITMCDFAVPNNYYNGTCLYCTKSSDNTIYITHILSYCGITHIKKEIKLNISNDVYKIVLQKKYDIAEYDNLCHNIKNSKLNICGIHFVSDNNKHVYIQYFNCLKVIDAILEKTDNVDVYYVYNSDNNKLGIAYISTLNDSLFLQEKFKTTDKLNIKCKYNTYFNKWQPIDCFQ